MFSTFGHLTSLQFVPAPIPMLSKRLKRDFSRFIDDEAVASDRDSDDLSDSDTFVDDEGDNGVLSPFVRQYFLSTFGTPIADFIEHTDDHSFAPHSSELELVRWDDIDDNASEADRLAGIAFEIQNRYKETLRDPSKVVILPNYPSLDDAAIWRVRVKVRSNPLSFCVLAYHPEERV